METVTPVRTYAVVLTTLLGLTALTTGIAFVDLGRLNAPVALVIAVTKAVLVSLVFMHLRESTRLTVAVALSALFWLGIMITLVMTDYVTRSLLTYG